jgi:hypothetical protein
LSKRLLVLVAGILAIGLIAAGCGDSDDDSSDATASITKAELIKQGDAICQKGNEAIEAEADEFAKENDIDTSNPTEAQQEEVIADVVAPNVRAQAEDLAGLGAPSSDEAKIDAIVEAVEKGADELESDPGSLLDEGSDPLDEGTKLAKQYGFKTCGEE